MGPDISQDELPPVSVDPQSVRVQYQAWLDEVDDALTSAALVVADAMSRVCRSPLEVDRGGLAEARRMAADVRERCGHVEEQAFLLLAREAPVSGDLRRLVAILRLVGNVDRTARLTLHVAESVDQLDLRAQPTRVRQQFEELAARSTEVFGRGVDAWRQRDGLAVHELVRLDADVDTLRNGLLDHARDLGGSASDLLLVGLLARYLERLADHGVVFAQHATFVVTGERIDVGA